MVWYLRKVVTVLRRGRTSIPSRSNVPSASAIRLYLPIVGMLGFDWGYGFDNQVGSSKRHGGELHFMMGQEF